MIKSKNISIENTAKMLKEADNIDILTHEHPDGDTLGSAAALCRSLQLASKNARVICGDEIPQKFKFLFDALEKQIFETNFVIAVDVADFALLGKNLKNYENKIDLCIDHHSTNAENIGSSLLCNPDAAANCEIIYKVILEANLPFDEHTAKCLYTGILTDTGCFNFPNTTSETHQIVANLMKNFDINIGEINRKFSTKTRNQIKLSSQILSNLEYYFNEKCTFQIITLKMIEESGLRRNFGELDELKSLIMQPEGVIAGISATEQDDGTFKISLRSTGIIDVSKIAQEFGGGGHFCAAAFNVNKDINLTKSLVLSKFEKSLNQLCN